MGRTGVDRWHWQKGPIFRSAAAVLRVQAAQMTQGTGRLIRAG
jgi:hypothetical protein